MLKNLLSYWRINLAVLLAAAVACAVPTGAWLVGESVRYSRRDLTLGRLRKVPDSCGSARVVRATLASEIATSPQFQKTFSGAAPAFLLRGSAVHSDSKRRASQIQIAGVDSTFIDLFVDPSDSERKSLVESFDKKTGQVFASVVINSELAKELNAKVGDSILLSFQKETHVPSESVIGYKDPEEMIRNLRLTVTRILPEQGMGRFSLGSNQNLSLNAF